MIRLIRVSALAATGGRRDPTRGTPIRSAKTMAQPLGVAGCGVVGKAGFEPAISRSRTGRDTRLRYFPRLTFSFELGGRLVPNRVHWCQIPKLLRRLVCQLVTKLAPERGFVLRSLIAR